MIFAEVWGDWRGPGGEILRTFPIITTPASEDIRPIHDRMPAILLLDECELWLGETYGDPERLPRPREDLPLTIWPISRQVNSPNNNDARLLQLVGR